MKNTQIHLLFALVLCALVAANTVRVPLQQKRSSGGLRIKDARGLDTDVVDKAALKRAINHINRRYGSSDSDGGQNVEKRWLNSNFLKDHIQDKEIFSEDDNIASKIQQAIAGIFPSNQGGDASSSNGRVGQAGSSNKDQSIKGKTGSATASVPLEDNVQGSSDFEFVGEIKIGTPAQTFKIDPDTGSADLWIIDKSCKAENCGPDSRGKFSIKASKTYKEVPNKKFELHYGIGDVSGKFARDTVQFDSLKITNQAIGLADQTSPDWKDDKASGVLGLGFRSITSAGQRPLIQNLAAQNDLQQQVVSFAFGRYLSGTQGKSEMLFGSINDDLHKGDLSYYQLSKVGYWQVATSSFSAGGKKGVQGTDIILDTGTSLIAASKDQVQSFWSGVKGATASSDGQSYTYPCDTKVNAQLKMPDGRTFKIDEKDINIGKESAGSNNCVGAVLIADTPGSMIMGLSMLKNVYSVFDFGKERVGLGTPSF